MKTITNRTNRCTTANRRLRLGLAAAACLFAGSAIAKDKAPTFTMTVISNEKFSQKVLNGDYEAAIEKISGASERAVDSFSAQTNLCVAYTKVGELDRAAGPCNMAVQIVREKRNSRPRMQRSNPHVDAADRSDLAIALSNRGVLRAARGEHQLALADFEASLDLDAGLSAPGINLARLDDRSRY